MKPVLHKGVWLGFALLLGVAPWLVAGGFWLSLLSQMGIAIIACLSFNILMGQGGMLSFGHAVYSGLGAFAAMYALNHWCPGPSGLPVTLVPLVGGLAGLLCATVLGWLSTRSAGTAFAMITLSIGELVFAVALMLPSLSGGEAGLSGNRVVGAAPWGITFGPAIQVYYLIAAYTLVCAALMVAFTATPLGRLLNAARDNPQRLAFVGYVPQRVRTLALVISGFFAGVAGGLATLNFEIVNAEALGAARSGAYLLFTFLGGSANHFGPVLGGVLMVLATVLLSAWTQAWLLYLGLLFMVMVIWAPDGLAGLVQAHLRGFRQGNWPRLLPTYLGLWLCGTVALCGAGALVEMTYRLQLQAVQGTTLRYLGQPLDVAQAASWILGVVVLLAGLLSFLLLRKRFALLRQGAGK
jgi:branched-chain amino acid transport system permease protein